MSFFLWPEEPVVKGRKQWFNPRPPVPVTNWKRPTVFPDLSGANAICWDFETYDPNLREKGAGWGRNDGHPVGLAVATDDGFKAYYPFKHEDEEQDNFPEKVVRDWMANQKRHKHIWNVYWNGGYDVGWEIAWGIDPSPIIYDGWVAEKLLLSSTSRRKGYDGASLEESGQRRVREGKKSVELLRWIHQYFGRGPTPSDEDLDESLKSYIYKTPPRLAGPYGESDALLPLRIGEVQRDLLEAQGLWELFKMECDLIPLFDRIRYEGVSVDMKAAEIADRETAIEISTLQKEVDSMAGCPVAVTEKDHLGRILYARGHKVPKTPKTNKFSVKEEYLKSLHDPFAEKVIELGELTKFRSSFIQGSVMENAVAGRIHGTLKPFGTITGRLSMERPNLQQIPSKNKRLMEIIRSIFIPDPGHAGWRKYDYSQLQMRILAHFAMGRGADELRQEYADNPATNYHKLTHAMILNLTGVDLPHKQIKNCNFAGVFGAGQNKIARMIGLSPEEVEPFFTAYHTGLPYVKDTMDGIAREVCSCGHSTTILGRRVNFDLYEARFHRGQERLAFPFNKACEMWGSNVQRAFLHKAMCYVIQGSEADLVKKALWKCLKSGIFDVIGVPKLLVHDEKNYSVSEYTKPVLEAFKEMKRIMETAVSFKVPILVAGEEGANWGSTKEF